MGKAILVALLAIIVCAGIVLGAVFAVLHSPWLVSRLARAFGYGVGARTISLSPSLSGSMSGLSVKSLRDDALTLLVANVTTKNSLGMILRGEIDTLVLQHPTFTFRASADSGTRPDLSFLQALPNVRLLEIHDGAARFTSAGGQDRLELTGADVTVRQFSPKTGGSIALQTSFTLTSAGETAIAASGRLTARFQLSAVYPRPYGTGTVELALDSVTHTSGGRTVQLGRVKAAADVVYERGTETLAITALRGESADLGRVQGAARAVLRGDTPWSARLSAGSIDFAQLFALVKPFLPADYRAWTTQGKGAVDAELQGTYVNGHPSFSGQMTLSFSQGGFSSPDSTKAAQATSGKIILKLRYASVDRKVAFNVRWEERDGEYLWGTYYGNLAGQTASLAMDGTLSPGSDWACQVSGSLDALQTGDYSFRGGGTRQDWTLHVRIANVSHARIVQALLNDLFTGVSPSLANLSATGTSSLEVVIRRDGGTTRIVGTYRMTGSSFRAPAMGLAVQEMAAEVPFDLVYPSAGATPHPSAAPGLVRFTGVEGKWLAIDSLQVPVVVAQNALTVPEPVVLPFFGGQVRLYGVRVDDVLSPRRYDFGLEVKGADLGRLTRRLTGTEYPGVVDADLGRMTYAHDRIASAGRAVIRVFGGEIQVTDAFAENMGSSPRIGGDVTFRAINLEEVTRQIAIGKMTGIIQGSLRKFVMDYGQPASFVLEIESVKALGVEQRISLDAIESISILGTGAAGVLSQGITRFFKEYPYSRIGVRCVLANDQFSVNGTIHEGGREYLVRRGFLRGVDVVNQNPENVISFRDMQERIGRILRARQTPPAGARAD